MKRLSSMMILGLFLVSLLAFGVSAEAYVPADLGDGLSGFFTGLKELFTGGETNYDNWYLMSFLLYFIIFMAIFWEGVHFLPIFGDKGDVNNAGKWFAGAAAGLSTLSIFFVEQATQKTTRSLIQDLLAPFGLYGAFAIAALMTYITYKFLTDTELFEEKALMAMGISASIGLVMVGYILTSNTLLGWGLVIMSFIIVAGLGSALVSANKESAELDDDYKKKTFWGGAIKDVRRPLKRYMKTAINEHVWITRIETEINDSNTANTICGVTEADNNVKLESGKNRASRRMKKREDDFIKTLKPLRGISAEWKTKVDGWIQRIEVFQNTLISIFASGGELEKVLKKPCSASYTQVKKKKELDLLIKQALAADAGILALINTEIDGEITAEKARLSFFSFSFLFLNYKIFINFFSFFPL